MLTVSLVQTEMPSMAPMGVSAEDMSPMMPDDTYKEEQKLDTLYKAMKRTIRRADNKQEKMQARANELAAFIDDSVKGIQMDVKELNSKATDGIRAAPEIQGPRGPPGVPGISGAAGFSGPNGPAGGAGPRGVAGR